jgi:predicted dehydrogenase
MLKGGVFGFGGVGQGMTTHINLSRWYGDDAKIVAVCNRGKEKRDFAEKNFGLKAYEKIDDLIAHGLDFMLIVSNSQAHKDAAVKCAKAGIPYLIEKPIALTVADAEEIVRETEKAGVINAVNYSMRYEPIFQQMKHMAQSGELGDILSVWACTWRGHGFHLNGKRHRAIIEPHESGGWIVHHMCHVVDFVIWIAGEVSEVYALTKSTAPAELEAEEITWATVRFKNGALGMLGDQIGMLRDHASGVVGTKAGISEVQSGVKPLLKLCRETDIEFRPPHIVDPEDRFPRVDCLDHFLKCLRAKKPSNVPVSEASYSLKVCHAIRESAHSGRIVKLD